MDSEQQSDWYSDQAATFGDRLAGAREACGLSHKDLARHIGVKENTARAWEDDLAEPRANKLQMLSGMLNVPMRWLMTGEGAGLGEPDAGELPAEISDLLLELRDIRGQATALAARVGRIEKSMRVTMKDRI